MLSVFFFSSKCSLFHNGNLFGSCIIHILYTGCAEIKINNSGAKGLICYAVCLTDVKELVLYRVCVLLQDKMKIYSHAILYKYDEVLSFLKKGFTVYIGPLIASLLLLLLLSSSSSSSSSPLCRVFILISLRQTMSLGNSVLQLFCCFYSWCLYR